MQLKAFSVTLLLVSSALHAAQSEPIGPGARGEPVLRAQVLLDRVRFSPGEIDGVYGDTMRQAIVGFQQARRLEVTGLLDAATWTELETDSEPVLVSYTVTQADAAGPYRKVPSGMAAKATRRSLGYASAAEALGERFHASPRLLKQLNPGKVLGRAGEQILVPNVAGEPLPAAARIVVDRSDRTLALLDDAGNTIAQFPVTTGSERDPLPVGTWAVTYIAKNPVFHYNPKLFWDAAPDERPAIIPAGPNSPVGVVWINLSKQHYGIHGTPEPRLIGKTASHGCVRLTNWDAQATAQAITAGLPVILQE